MSDKDLPSPELLRKLLRYEPETGKLYWQARPISMFATEGHGKTWNKRYAGKEAFTHHDEIGYKRGAIFSRSHLAHRVIWAVVTGAWPNAEIDHINGDRLDNCWHNLRAASRAQNARNLSNWGRSKYRGVSWIPKRKKWTAVITISKKSVYLGSFVLEVDAAKAYDLAAKKAEHGNFFKLNFPDGRSTVS